MSILLAIPIGIIYNLLISKISSMITKDYEYNEKIQKNIIVEIISGIGAIAMAFYIFNNKKCKNKTAMYGLLLGGGLLLFSSLVSNWNVVNDYTKIITLGGIMIFFILYSYKFEK